MQHLHLHVLQHVVPKQEHVIMEHQLELILQQVVLHSEHHVHLNIIVHHVQRDEVVVVKHAMQMEHVQQQQNINSIIVNIVRHVLVVPKITDIH